MSAKKSSRTGKKSGRPNGTRNGRFQPASERGTKSDVPKSRQNKRRRKEDKREKRRETGRPSEKQVRDDVWVEDDDTSAAISLPRGLSITLGGVLLALLVAAVTALTFWVIYLVSGGESGFGNQSGTTQITTPAAPGQDNTGEGTDDGNENDVSEEGGREYDLPEGPVIHGEAYETENTRVKTGSLMVMKPPLFSRNIVPQVCVDVSINNIGEEDIQTSPLTDWSLMAPDGSKMNIDLNGRSTYQPLLIDPDNTYSATLCFQEPTLSGEYTLSYQESVTASEDGKASWTANLDVEGG